MRKFGVEIELNSFDNRDFKENPLLPSEMPEGINYIAELIENLGKPVVVNKWQHTHNNATWVCKPDSSCGIEVCSPVSNNIEDITEIINVLSKDKNIVTDSRCSFHVHFDVQDYLFYNNEKLDFNKCYKLAAILAWWIKCEAIIFDSFPDCRKLNKYCQCVGLSDLFRTNEEISSQHLINKLSDKYFSINTFHLNKNIRPTIEFRLAEHTACLNSDLASNWILFLDNFLNRAVYSGIPDSLCWLDPKDFFDFLDLNNNLKIRDWFLNRIFNNINSEIYFWKFYRKNSFLEFKEILKYLQLDKDPSSSLFQKYK